MYGSVVSLVSLSTVNIHAPDETYKIDFFAGRFTNILLTIESILKVILFKKSVFQSQMGGKFKLYFEFVLLKIVYR